MIKQAKIQNHQYQFQIGILKIVKTVRADMVYEDGVPTKQCTQHSKQINL